MKRQTVLGSIFLTLGVIVALASLAPILSKPPGPFSIWVLLAGFVVAIFGALMIPFSGADKALDTVAIKVENTNLPFFGRGVGSAAPTSTTTVTVETPKEVP